jgi:hypothetical protein
MVHDACIETSVCLLDACTETSVCLVRLANLLDCNYRTSLVDLIYSNCKVIDQSNDWSLLLFKEAFHIHCFNPALNHGMHASKELTIFR